MKKSILYIIMVSVMALIAMSCTKRQPADARELLKGVPSDASMVAVANLGAMLEDMGCKVDGTKAEASSQVKDLLASAQPERRQLLQSLLDGESGIDLSVLVCFVEGYYQYVTGVVTDPAKFRAMCQKELQGEFSDADGVSVCRNAALVGNRFWYRLDKGDVDPREVKHFATLAESQSFLTNKGAEDLCEVDEDIEGWGNIAGFLNTSGMGFQQRASLQVALETIYEDAAEFTFDIEFGKGEAEAELSVLNSKGKEAKCQLPVKKLDMATVGMVAGNADALLALNIPRKLVEKLTKETSGKGTSLLGIYLSAMQSVDGTAALALAKDSGSVNGVITTDGTNTSGLNMMLTQMGLTVTIDGKFFKVSRGTMDGKMPVSEMTGYLEEAAGGIVAPNNGMLMIADNGIRLATLTLHPDGGSLKLKVKAVGTDPKENFLLTLLKDKK